MILTCIAFRLVILGMSYSEVKKGVIMTKQIVVIGGGPAGIEAAKAAAKVGSAVTLVSNAPVGGRAGWHSLLPSKVWLTAADSLGLFAEADELGMSGAAGQAEPSAIVARIKAVKESWNGQQRAELEALGVKVVMGTAVFTDPHTLTISNDEGEQTMTADAFIVATGSVPIFPPTMKPNGKTIIAPRFASALDSLPESMVVVGAGATGTEFVYLFNRLGLNVTWIVDQFGVLPDFDDEAGQVLADEFAARGVRLVSGHMAERIDQTDESIAVVTTDGERHPAAMAFLAIGRKPDTAGLNLEAAGLTLEKGTVKVDENGCSAQSHIYLVGDATGLPMIANRAMAQAWAAGQHAAGQSPVPFSESTVIGAVYAEPQVAQVGKLSGENIETVKVPFSASLKGQLLPQGDAFVKLAYDGENGRLTGAVAVGHHAADVLAPVMVAIHAGIALPDFAALYAAHPTMSELVFAAARAI
jgi:pyruvate/2-oxoglutarate dehydrogenase complex dihydrolipoamide dehydrogenase (E3) component